MQGRPVYELRVKNASKRRGVVDLSVGVMLRATGLKMFPASRGTTVLLLPIFHYAHSVLRLVPDKGSRVIRLDIDETFRVASVHHRHAFSMDKYDPKTNNPLEYLLSQGQGGSLIVEMLGYDEWSGSRKCFESSGYGVGSIVQGQFNGLEISPFSEPEINLIPAAQLDAGVTLGSYDTSSRLSEAQTLRRGHSTSDVARIPLNTISGRGALMLGGFAFGVGVTAAVRWIYRFDRRYQRGPRDNPVGE